MHWVGISGVGFDDGNFRGVAFIEWINWIWIVHEL